MENHKQPAAVVFLADGLEECEGLIAVDLLRRGGVNVITASISDSKTIVSSHGITLQADQLAGGISYENVDMIILPGGYKGTLNLSKSSLVAEKVKAFAADPAKQVAAICAAPSVLGDLGVLEGKKATCYPGWEDHLRGAVVTGQPVVEDGRIVTGNGLGAAIPFALTLLRRLMGQEKAEEIRRKIQYPFAVSI